MLLMEKNRIRYPRTLYSLVGRDGLVEAGVFTGQVRRTVESLPDDWFRSFYEFRNWINEQLGRSEYD